MFFRNEGQVKIFSDDQNPRDLVPDTCSTVNTKGDTLRWKCRYARTNERTKRINKQVNVNVKLSLFTDGMILCIENPKEATTNTIRTNNRFGKFAGYKINTQNNCISIH